ncbi:MAG: hypothetical protein HKP58_12985, partial [Desulfatitalea sp.]|nr:hypothetical protein [Desulfatitalea sp.]NNK01314.1 hypothetical protein [Desulfatitalea sp.]
MNYYMPYTYLSEAMIETLTAAFGLLAVTQPSAASVPPHMQAAADRGSLQLMFPRQVDTQRLEDTLQAFNQWADVHHGSGGTLKGLFLSGQHARTEEASANQIRGVLRRFDAASPQSTPDPVFQAALFLALAQSYDRQHDALNLDLAGVSDLER